MSVATAHARPNLELAELSARAGDVVHFSLTGVTADNGTTYVLEVAGAKVTEGAVASGGVSGAITIPDLGNRARNVMVEATLRDAGKRKKDKRKLEYLGPALPGPLPPDPVPPVTVDPAPAPSPPAPAAAPQAASSPAPAYSPKASDGAAPLVAPRSSRRPHESRTLRATDLLSEVGRSREGQQLARTGRRRGHGVAKSSRSKRRVRRGAPPFDRIYVPGTGIRARNGEDVSSRNVSGPGAAVMAAGRTAHGGVGAALVAPATVGLAGLTLAGFAALRRRRLTASKSSKRCG